MNPTVAERLPRRIGGYDPRDVDELVGVLQRELGEKELALHDLRARLVELDQALARRHGLERRLQETQVEAQSEAKQLREAARRWVEERRASTREAIASRRAELEQELAALGRWDAELDAVESSMRAGCRAVLAAGLAALGDGTGRRAEDLAPVQFDEPVQEQLEQVDEHWPGQAGEQPPVAFPDDMSDEEGSMLVPLAWGPVGELPGDAEDVVVEDWTTDELAVVIPAGPKLPAWSEPGVAWPAVELLSDEPDPFAPPSFGPAGIRILARSGGSEPTPPAVHRTGRRMGLLAVAICAVLIGGVGLAVAALLTRGDSPSTPDAAAAKQATVSTAPDAGVTEPPPAVAIDDDPPAEAAPATGAEPSATDAEAAAENAAPLRPVTLALTGRGGETWVLVRRGSGTGAELFDGFLLPGESRTFQGRRLWVRMGQPTTLSVELDGREPKGLPSGTASVVFTEDGVEILEGR